MLLTEEILNAVRKAISEAELQTSGEIKVHIEKHCRGNVMDRAAFIFRMLGMEKTAMRNGVLFYLAWKDRKFAILADSGINDMVPPDFWDRIRDHMQNQFKAGRFMEGLCEGIQMAGEALKEFFPYQKEDINELSNEISLGNN